MKHPNTEIDLRKELLQLDLNSGEVDAWLGSEFETDFRFEHDIPLQRSISLDRGIDIFEYLQSIESHSSDSVSASYWSVSSGEVEMSLRLERDRSFEDIPASPLPAKSRHISLDVTNSMMGDRLALSLLRETYKGIDAEGGTATPQIKKLKKTYSKIIEEHKDFGKISTERLARAATEVDMSDLRRRVPMYRSVSLDVEGDETQEAADDRKLRQRRFGVTTNVWQDNPIRDGSEEVLIGQKLNEHKSCDEIFVKSRVRSPLVSLGDVDNSTPFADLKERYKKAKNDVEYSSNRNLKRNVSFNIGNKTQRKTPSSTRVTTRDTRDNATRDIDIRQVVPPDLIEVDRNCDCRICSEEVDDHRKSFLSRNLHKIFMRIVSYKEYRRNLVYRDENNCNQMYACVIHVLKLLLGLWLRHFDHKQPTICF